MKAHPSHGGSGDSYWNWYESGDDDRGYAKKGPDEIRKALAPLLEILAQYDRLRRSLERKGGTVTNLNRITATLMTSVTLSTNFGDRTVQLKNQSDLRSAIKDVSYELHLDVRQTAFHMPLYYLCRTRGDYWAQYSLIVEDMYTSPGFGGMTDPRFVKLMRGGREVYHLRLAQFRNQFLSSAKKEVLPNRDSMQIDTAMCELGRHIFQAAWHEDQRLGFMITEHLDLPDFREAVELLYLILSSELCEVRSAVNEKMRQFFESAYPHPPIRRFLDIVTELDGSMLNELPRQAKELYKRLIQAFSSFLSTEVSWGSYSRKMPLWKIIYGNFYRLEMVKAELLTDQSVAEQRVRLEESACAVIDNVLSGANGGAPAWKL